MSDPARSPLTTITVYNPDLLTKEELIAQFVARTSLLEALVDDLRRTPPNSTPQHHLIIGPRGMGKTTLLRRLRHAIEDDPQLSLRWIPLCFPEEQYNVARLSDFWENCLDALGDALQDAGRVAEARELDADVESLPGGDEPLLANRAFSLLKKWTEKLDRGLALLIDNADLVLDRLKEHDWTVREILSMERRLAFFGASATQSESTYVYQRAFYDFFRVHELRGLSLEEAREMILNLARLRATPKVAEIIDKEPGRFVALHLLTGGNPRTMVLLYEVLVQDDANAVYQDLESLLDRHTPLYKDRFESMPAQAQQIVDALSLNWDPMTASDLAKKARLDVKIVSSQLTRLVKDQIVEVVPLPPGKRQGFQVRERFFNIWYLMRSSRRVRRRLIWYVEFLKHFYGPSELSRRAIRELRSSSDSVVASATRRAESKLALASSLPVGDPVRLALENRVLSDLEVGDADRLLDLNGADSELRPMVDRMRKFSDARQIFNKTYKYYTKKTSPLFNNFRSFACLIEDIKLHQCIKVSSNSRKGRTKDLENYTELSLALFHILKHQYLFLYESIICGLMQNLDDVPGAEAAAIMYDAPILAVTARLLRPRAFERYESIFFDLQVASSITGQSEASLMDGLGRILEYSGRTEDSILIYKILIEKNPEDPWAHSSLSRLLLAIDRELAEAERCARTAYQLSLQFTHAMLLTRFLLKAGRTSEGTDLLRSAILAALEADGTFEWEVIAELGELARDGHSTLIVEILDQTGTTERVRPLREALWAYALNDPDYLLTVAPEIRRPAVEILFDIEPTLPEVSRTINKRSPKRKPG